MSAPCGHTQITISASDVLTAVRLVFPILSAWHVILDISIIPPLETVLSLAYLVIIWLQSVSVATVLQAVQNVFN